MIVLYSLIALFIAWIWVDYFLRIDIFERESLKYYIFIFLLGGVSVLVVNFMHWLTNSFWGFSLNGKFLNDFAFSVFQIGALEEFSKILPFVVFYFIFKKQLNEPVDYLAYICTAALGFSAVENVLYFYNYGPEIINGRAILSSVGHMFNTAIFAYGIILYKFKYKKNGVLIIIVAFFAASLSHGFYDFWLIYEKTNDGGWIVTMLYFLITISIFATILNNSLNNSLYFTYKRVIPSNKIAIRLLTYYGVVFVLQFFIIGFVKDWGSAFGNVIGALYTMGFIVFVATVRLSRFKLIKNRWQRIKVEMPFTITPRGAGFYGLDIRGESSDESKINVFYEEYFYLKPINSCRTDAKTYIAYIDKKIFLNDETSLFRAKVFLDEELNDFDIVYISLKKCGLTITKNKNQILMVSKYDGVEEIDDFKLKIKDFKFVEWAVMVAS